jgi:hypothetical protein
MPRDAPELFGPDAIDPAALKERMMVREAVEYERYCRDYGLWNAMAKMFLPGARVRISWFDGSGQDFATKSQHMIGATHKLHSMVVQVKNGKALAEVVAQIGARRILGGGEVDLISDVRLLYKLEKAGGAWKILSIDCIYERDALRRAAPGGEVALPAEAGTEYRASYRWLSYVLTDMGLGVNDELPGEDRPDTVAVLYRQSMNWLNEGDRRGCRPVQEGE